MTHFKPALALALAAALSLSLLSGCSSGADVSTPPVDLTAPIVLADVADPALTCAGIPGDTVVATVGGHDITAASLLYWLATYTDQNMQYYSSAGLTELPWDQEYEGKTLEQSLTEAALDMAALYALLPAKAAELNLTLSDDTTAQVNETLDAMKESMGSDEAMDHYLWQYPLSRELFLSLCEAEELAALLQDSLYGENGTETITDEQVETYAAEELGYAYRAKHILLKTVDVASPILDADGNATGEYQPLDEATIAGKKALAEDILSRLDASSDPLSLFDELMTEYSEDPGLASNPDGYNATAGQMVAPFEEAALALAHGEYSGIVESAFGYHIILRLPLAEVCRDQYISYLTNQRYSQWIDADAPVTNDSFAKLDASDFYARLTELREVVNEELTALAEQQAAASGSASAAGSASGAASGSQG